MYVNIPFFPAPSSRGAKPLNPIPDGELTPKLEGPGTWSTSEFSLPFTEVRG